MQLDKEIMEVLRNADGPMTSRMIVEALDVEPTTRNVNKVWRNLRGLERYEMVKSTWTEIPDWVRLKRGQTYSNLMWEAKE